MNFNTLRAHPANPGRRPAILVAILAVTTIVSYLLWLVFPHIAEENHLIEWTQAAFLALACLAHVDRARKLDRKTLAFAIHAGLALLMYSFLMRELDINQFGDARVWTWTERFFRGIGILCWLRFFVFLAPRIKRVFAQLGMIFSTPMTVMIICGGILMACGWPFDKEVFHSVPLNYSQLFEELFELNGYMVLFAAALGDSSRWEIDISRDA